MLDTRFEGVMRGRLERWVGGGLPACLPAAAAAAAVGGGGSSSHHGLPYPAESPAGHKQLTSLERKTQRTAPPAVGRVAAMARVGRPSAETSRI